MPARSLRLVRWEKLLALVALLVFATCRLPGQAYTFSKFSGTALSGSSSGNAGFFVSGFAFGADGSIFLGDVSNHVLRKVDPSGRATTVAGAMGGAAVDGVGRAARLSRPYVTRIDAEGNVQFLDAGNGALRQLAPSGLVTTLAQVAAPADFGTGASVAVDAQGNAYVGDYYGGKIKKLSPTGAVSDVAFTPPGQGTLFGLAVDQAGNLYLAYTDHTIRRVAPDGATTLWAGTSGVKGSRDGPRASALFDQPGPMVVAGDGSLYLSDLNNKTLRRIAPSGAVTTVAGQAGAGGATDGVGAAARLGYMWPLTLHPSGLIYMADRASASIRTFDPATGAVATVASGLSSGDGPLATAFFNFPLHLALDSAGTLFVSELNSIRAISPEGVVRSLYSPPDSFFGLSETTTRLQSTGRLTSDGAGGVYVTDYFANTIARVSAAGAVTLVAGSTGVAGTANGVGAAAQFNFPWGIARDAAGNLFISDTRNFALRKIAPDGTVSLFAGLMGVSGTADGAGAAARFGNPQALAIDPSGILYVADGPSIRKVTPDGTVSTLVLRPHPTMGAFVNIQPQDLAADQNGNLFFCDSANANGIRKLTPDGVLTSISGPGGGIPTQYGTGSATRFIHPSGIAVDRSGTLYISQNISSDHALAKGVPTTSAPAFTRSPQTLSALPGGTVILTATATAAATYQWYRNGVAISGATSPAYSIRNAAAATHAGAYTVVATNAVGATTSTAATLTIAPSVNPGRFINLSVLAPIAAEQILTLGLYTGGTPAASTQPLLIRGLGPALQPFGVSDYLPDPRLSLHRPGSGETVSSNDNWAGNAAVAAANAAYTGLPLSDAASLDAATLATLPSNAAYTIQVRGNGAAGGRVLAEVYDTTPVYTPAAPRLTNLSTNTAVALNGSLTIGFAISGDTARTVLVRVSGPALRSFGERSYMPDPQLQLYQGQTLLHANAGWRDDPLIKAAATTVGAFPIADGASHDSAVLATLAPGAYTVTATSVTGSPGPVIIEAYEVP